MLALSTPPLVAPPPGSVITMLGTGFGLVTVGGPVLHLTLPSTSHLSNPITNRPKHPLTSVRRHLAHPVTHHALDPLTNLRRHLSTLRPKALLTGTLPIEPTLIWTALTRPALTRTTLHGSLLPWASLTDTSLVSSLWPVHLW